MKTIDPAWKDRDVVLCGRVGSRIARTIVPGSYTVDCCRCARACWISPASAQLGFEPLCLECAREVLGDRITGFTTAAQLAEAIEYFRFQR